MYLMIIFGLNVYSRRFLLQNICDMFLKIFTYISNDLNYLRLACQNKTTIIRPYLDGEISSKVLTLRNFTTKEAPNYHVKAL